MKKTIVDRKECDFPSDFNRMLSDAKIYDSSCSEAAKVYFIDKDDGFYLKRAAAGTLKNEMIMTEYMHKKGLAANVIDYISDSYDWLLTEKIRGEDCTFEKYIADPKLLCDTLAKLLRELHETDFSDCPVKNRTERYIETAKSNYFSNHYDKAHLNGRFGYTSAEEAYRIIEENKKLLKSDTLIHGDYCLPNIILDNWNFSGFIDVDCCGVGDKHIDIFWATWSLAYNLGTDNYRERFFDAYGRENFDVELIRIIGAFEVFG